MRQDMEDWYWARTYEAGTFAVGYLDLLHKNAINFQISIYLSANRVDTTLCSNHALCQSDDFVLRPQTSFTMLQPPMLGSSQHGRK